jgi:hypothetical protein
MTTAATEHRLICQDYRKLADMYRAMGMQYPEETALRQAAESYSAKNKHIPFGKCLEIVKGMVN